MVIQVEVSLIVIIIKSSMDSNYQGIYYFQIKHYEYYCYKNFSKFDNKNFISLYFFFFLCKKFLRPWLGGKKKLLRALRMGSWPSARNNVTGPHTEGCITHLKMPLIQYYHGLKASSIFFLFLGVARTLRLNDIVFKLGYALPTSSSPLLLTLSPQPHSSIQHDDEIYLLGWGIERSSIDNAISRAIYAYTDNPIPPLQLHFHPLTHSVLSLLLPLLTRPNLFNIYNLSKIPFCYLISLINCF